jgi:hypothetical protein
MGDYGDGKSTSTEASKLKEISLYSSVVSCVCCVGVILGAWLPPARRRHRRRRRRRRVRAVTVTTVLHAAISTSRALRGHPFKFLAWKSCV